MRRAINTIPEEEYNKLLREAMQRMAKHFSRLSDEEIIKMGKADNEGNYQKAEIHDFNARALDCMKDMCYKFYELNKED